MDHSTRPLPPAGRIACKGCGTVFTCDPAGACWCMEESFRLPMPPEADEDATCLCPACLRDAAGASMR
jgi:hypothetical protein